MGGLRLSLLFLCPLFKPLLLIDTTNQQQRSNTMEITKQLLLEKLTALRAGNIEAMQDEDISDEMMEQEEGIEATFDMVERMLKVLPDPATRDYSKGRITAKECTAHLKTYEDDAKIITLIWGESDVRSQNKDDEGNGEDDEDFSGTPLTDEQVDNVLSMMDNNHDCNYGVTWETIEAYIEEVK